MLCFTSNIYSSYLFCHARGWESFSFLPVDISDMDSTSMHPNRKRAIGQVHEIQHYCLSFPLPWLQYVQRIAVHFTGALRLCAPSSTTHINEQTWSFEMNLLEHNVGGLSVKCVKFTIKEKIILSIIIWQLSATFQAFLAWSEFFTLSLVLRWIS